jgi:hypothetical protein
MEMSKALPELVLNYDYNLVESRNLEHNVFFPIHNFKVKVKKIDLVKE